MTEFSQDFGICMNIGLGAELSLGTVAGGSLFVSLQGQECTIPVAGGVNRPAMNFVFGGANGWYRPSRRSPAT
ncbi:MAG: hypothetical protein R3F11_05950 [Verrucomicrobiales bacterium]